MSISCVARRYGLSALVFRLRRLMNAAWLGLK
jgi:hypothetical protein